MKSPASPAPTIGSLIAGAVLYVVVLGLLVWFLFEGQHAR